MRFAMVETSIDERSMKDREYRLAPLSDCLPRAVHNAVLAPSPPPPDVPQLSAIVVVGRCCGLKVSRIACLLALLWSESRAGRAGLHEEVDFLLAQIDGGRLASSCGENSGMQAYFGYTTQKTAGTNLNTILLLMATLILSSPHLHL